MRLFYLAVILISTFSLCSCGNDSTNDTEEGGFSKEVDTTYKDNSTEIESITRTFYKKGDLENSVKFYQDLGDSDIVVSVSNDSYDIGIALLSPSDFNLFLNNIDTVIKHYDKDLTYDFGSSILKYGEIVRGIEDNTANFYIYKTQGLEEMVSSYDVTKEDVENMRNSYKSYIAEKK
jgi:hypothetical protein